jgi:ABC-2 type transport system permease protein
VNLQRPGSIPWIARHEFRLAWRDFVAMATAGRPTRAVGAILLAIFYVLFMHWLADLTVRHFALSGADPHTLLVLTGLIVLAWSLMLSQALEHVTRAFYSRSDLDLLLSSPFSAPKLFAVRIVAISLGTMVLSLLLIAPFIDVLAWHGGPQWLSGYGVVVAMGSAAGTVAIILTDTLFRLIGPRRTRYASQILAAVIGAAFVIGIQVAAIVAYGNLSRLQVLESDQLLAFAPGPDSPLWLPARAALGDLGALAVVLAAGLGILAAAIVVFSGRFADHATAAASTAQGAHKRGGRGAFRPRSVGSALRRKEWALLRRDPWLMSQSLMQVLYLIPPALLLWRNYGEGTDVFVILAPVLVMAAGQLAGGLAWLAVSGEDAPDLISSAPLKPSAVTRAKVAAVMAIVALIFAPFVVAIIFASPWTALVAAVGVAVAALSAVRIQLWFRLQAKRTHFRRRHTSSRVATFAEALSSFAWAGTAGLAAAGTWFAVACAVVALIVLGAARALRPVEARRRPTGGRAGTPGVLSPA